MTAHGEASEIGPVPEHVPAELVRDFDFFAPPGAAEDVQLAWKRLHEEAPDIFWTPRNGGHWIATRADDIREIQTNHRRFSQRIIGVPAEASAYKLLPVNLDPPAHGPYRRIIMPAFTPDAINRLEAGVRAFAAEFVEELAPRGECEFVGDFASKLPIAVFLKMVDLPYADREILLPWAEAAIRSPDLAKSREAQANMMAYLAKWVAERRANPGNDLISRIVHAEVEDRPIATEEIFSLLTVVLFGGLDTVASLLGFICRFLATHPEHRRDLIAHPELQKTAVEELIRRHGIVNTARYITEDFIHKGIQFKAGDLIQIPNVLYGLDERLVADPTEVDFRRERVQHAAFGNGPHACPGAALARREIAAFMQAWLERIPDFRLKPGSKPQMASGHVNGLTRLELVWDVEKPSTFSG